MNIQDSHITATSADDILLRSMSDGIFRLTLNNPDSRNSLSEAMLANLQNAVDQATSDANVKVIIIAANGPVFCAGHDIKEITSHRTDSDGGKAYFKEIMEICSALMMSIVKCPKPAIAEVDTIATAAGCQLAASCDLIVASDSAKFCTPGVNIGLFCSTPMVALSRSISNKHAMEMLLTGDMIDATEAHRFGLVNTVVPSDELQSTTDALARQIASKSAAVLAIGKEAFYTQKEMPLDEAYAYCSETMVTNLLFDDAAEGLCAILEKRRPDWKDK